MSKTISTPFGPLKIYESPEPKKFRFESQSGYYHDQSTGFYYDPKSDYYFNPKTNQWMFWFSKWRTYINCEGGDLELKRQLQEEEREFNFRRHLKQQQQGQEEIGARERIGIGEDDRNNADEDSLPVQDKLQECLSRNYQLLDSLRQKHLMAKDQRSMTRIQEQIDVLLTQLRKIESSFTKLPSAPKKGKRSQQVGGHDHDQSHKVGRTSIQKTYKVGRQDTMPMVVELSDDEDMQGTSRQTMDAKMRMMGFVGNPSAQFGAMGPEEWERAAYNDERTSERARQVNEDRSSREKWQKDAGYQGKSPYERLSAMQERIREMVENEYEQNHRESRNTGGGDKRRRTSSPEKYYQQQQNRIESSFAAVPRRTPFREEGSRSASRARRSEDWQGRAAEKERERHFERNRHFSRSSPEPPPINIIRERERSRNRMEESGSWSNRTENWPQNSREQMQSQQQQNQRETFSAFPGQFFPTPPIPPPFPNFRGGGPPFNMQPSPLVHPNLPPIPMITPGVPLPPMHPIGGPASVPLFDRRPTMHHDHPFMNSAANFPSNEEHWRMVLQQQHLQAAAAAKSPAAGGMPNLPIMPLAAMGMGRVPPELICPICGCIGHNPINCPMNAPPHSSMQGGPPYMGKRNKEAFPTAAGEGDRPGELTLNLCLNCGRPGHEQVECRSARISDAQLQKRLRKAKEKLQRREMELQKRELDKQQLKRKAEKYQVHRKNPFIQCLREVAPRGMITKESIRHVCSRCGHLNHSWNECRRPEAPRSLHKQICMELEEFTKTFFFHLNEDNLVDFSQKFDTFTVMDAIEQGNAVDPVGLQLQAICHDGIVTQKHLSNLCSRCANLGHKEKDCREKESCQRTHYEKMLTLVKGYRALVREGKGNFYLPLLREYSSRSQAGNTNAAQPPPSSRRPADEILLLDSTDDEGDLDKSAGGGGSFFAHHY